MKLSERIGSSWARLATPTRQGALRVDPREISALPAPAARWLGRVLPAGVPLDDAAIVEMAGEIKLGGRWLPFTARQLLRAGVGFVWKPVIGGRLLRFVGADLLTPDEARMDFRLHGLLPVARSSGLDTARSATGRLAAETVAWLPQATTPRAGAHWRAVDGDSAAVTLNVGEQEVEVCITVDDEGRLRAMRLERWNDAVEPAAFEPFGGDVHEEYDTVTGVKVAGCGEVGWGYGTPTWDGGVFFRYRVVDVGSVGLGVP